MPSLPDIARETSLEYDMLPPGAVVLALVSGGADSTALLRLLAAGGSGDFTGRLSVLHVNHMLRGDDADADADFVRAVCDDLAIPCRVVDYDVARYAAGEDLNLEDAGRRIRYAFAENELDGRCAAAGVSPLRGRIVTAHTLDDQMETFLMRLVTGSGPGGLRAMPPVRGRIVRPLLGARRADIVRYLEEIGQGWREDASNADTTRLRSWVRHDLLPVVERVNPSFDATLCRNLRIIAEEDSLLSDMSGAFARDFAGVDSGRLAFDRTMMATLSRPMARRTLRDALVRAFPEASRIEAAHIEALLGGIESADFARDLPFGLRAEVEYGKLTVFRRGESPAPVAPCLLAIPGTCDLGPLGVIEARIVDVTDVSEDPYAAYVDADLIAGELVVDAPREGDRMQPLGMEGSKKLQDLLTDAKVPRRLRAATPVVRDGGSIAWVAGVRLSEAYKVSSQTRRVVALVWTREQNST
ncbi:MAG: tRNA lysidine(34) synthetase TilS [Coriobacteriia bacterium]